MANNFIQKFQEDIKRFWDSLSKLQKGILIGLSIISLAAIVFISVWAQNPDWATLYSKLDEKDAGEIINKIKEAKVPYKITDNGSTIMVPAKNVHDLRLQLATEGLPKHGKIGFELFDKNNFGMTDFVQKLNYQRALQGELERTISQIEGIENSRVHLVIPDEKLFSDKEQEPTASVVLKLKPGVQLTDYQIRSISHLVAASVEGLKEENVTITDTNGNILLDKEILTKSSEKDKFKLNAEQLEYQKKIEDKIKYNVQTMMDKIVGPNNSVVRTSVEIDFDQEEVKSETYTPNANNDDIKAIRSQRTVEEAGQGRSVNPGGVPGVTSNIPSYQELNNEGQTSFSRRDITTNYEVPKTVTTVVKTPGKIKRISVSVAVNNVDPENVEMLENIRRMVVAAAGLDLTRGDNVAVTSYQFDTTLEEREQALIEARERQQFYLQLGGIILAIVALIALLASLRMAFSRKVPEIPPLPEPEPEMLPLLADQEELFKLAEPDNIVELIEAKKKREDAIRSISELVRNDPANMARLLKAWME